MKITKRKYLMEVLLMVQGLNIIKNKSTVYKGKKIQQYIIQFDCNIFSKREKEVLQETVTKLQNALSKIRDKESDTCDQVKRSLDAAEQAQYEKNAAELEIRRLKDELERQHSKLREAISDQVS